MSQTNINNDLPIVSSSHLAGDKGVALSEFEYALTMTNNAFQRWIQSCGTASGLQNLSPLDILVLHNLQHRNREKRIADVAFILNIEDIHNVSYSVRKLVKQDLVIGNRKGKETFYQVSEHGKNVCQEYRKIRDKCLLDTLERMRDKDSLGDVAEILRTLSGFYDQAARAARSL